MTSNFLRAGLKILIALYICLNATGCATPAAVRYAEEQANEPPTYRSITDVYFAAFRAPDQLRLCVLADAGGIDEPSPATLTVDLQEFSNSLDARALTAHDNTSLAYNSIGSGSELKTSCQPALQAAEEPISIERIQVEGADLANALRQLTPEELTVFVLHQDDTNYFVIGSTGEDFPGLNNAAFIAHVQDNASNAGYVLVPFALVADAFLGIAIFVGLLVCWVGGGSCGL